MTSDVYKVQLGPTQFLTCKNSVLEDLQKQNQKYEYLHHFYNNNKRGTAKSVFTDLKKGPDFGSFFGHFLAILLISPFIPYCKIDVIFAIFREFQMPKMTKKWQIRKTAILGSDFSKSHIG